MAGSESEKIAENGIARGGGGSPKLSGLFELLISIVKFVTKVPPPPHLTEVHRKSQAHIHHSVYCLGIVTLE